MARLARLAPTAPARLPRPIAPAYPISPARQSWAIRLIGRGRCPAPLLPLLTRSYGSRRAADQALALARLSGWPTYRLAPVAVVWGQ